jgi:hypothetical protein
MKVKLLVPICGPEGSFQPGSEVDLSEKLATALIKDKYAESLEKTPVEVVKAEPPIIAEKAIYKQEEIKPVKGKSSYQRR